jgi:hypothetical protein
MSPAVGHAAERRHLPDRRPPPMMVAILESIMPAWAIYTFAALALATLLATPALAEHTAVQEVACQPGGEVQLARDGTVTACRLAAAAELLVGAGGGNARAACAAGAQVEFHRNGYLSFCNPSGVAATYLGRGGRSTQCRGGSRIAFDESGVLEYCS